MPLRIIENFLCFWNDKWRGLHKEIGIKLYKRSAYVKAQNVQIYVANPSLGLELVDSLVLGADQKFKK